MSEKIVKILIVEDNFADYKIVGYFLDNAPKSIFDGEYELSHADYLSAGISMLDQGHFDIVILDLNLPDENGMESLRRVLKATDLPIIVMTGINDMETAYAAIKDGAEDYIVKESLDSNDLAKSIHYALERSKNKNLAIQVALEKDRVNMLRSLISEVSHDIRTPLTVIGTSVYLLAKTNNMEHLEVISGQISRLQNLINDFTQLAKLDYAVENPQFNEEDIVSFLKRLVSDYKPIASVRNRNLAFSSQSQQCSVCFDSHLLYRAVGNVISNGLKYTADDGNIKLELVDRGEYVLIYIEDDGVGIPEEDQKKVFNRFFRASQAKDYAEGSGLGLTITKKVVDLHNGRIELESSVGVGTKITIVLPKAFDQ